MKNLSTLVLGLCAVLCTTVGLAQNQQIPLNEPDYNKPKLFNDLPESFVIDTANMVSLFQLQVGQTVTIPLTANFSYAGVVVSKSSDQSYNSIVIKSTNRQGASFTFSRVFEEYGVKYIGRMMSLQHSDAFEIVFENNQYHFKKKGLYDLYAE
ncbi:MAG: hypothetical protein C4308_01175 [Chitinophagaceae bacterium]